MIGEIADCDTKWPMPHPYNVKYRTRTEATRNKESCMNERRETHTPYKQIYVLFLLSRTFSKKETNLFLLRPPNSITPTENFKKSIIQYDYFHCRLSQNANNSL